MPWLISIAALAAAAVAAWTLPGSKEQAVLGRLGYAQFALALALTAAALLAALAWRSPRARKRIAALGLGLALALAAAELGARALSSKGSLHNPFYSMNDPGNLAAEELPYARPAHVDWSGPSIGDLSGGVRDAFTTTVRFRTDFEGFRNDEDRRRAELVFLGDSNTEAGNVDEADTFAARTARELGCSWRNLGRAGYAPPSELVVLRRFGLACEPKVIVWQISEQNDLGDCVRYAEWVRSGKPPFFDMEFARETPDRDGWKRFSPTFQLFERLRRPDPWPFEADLRTAEGPRVRMRFWLGPFGAELDPAGHAGWPAIDKALRDGAAIARQNGLRVLVLLVPTKLRVYEAAVEPHLALQQAIAKGGGIPRPAPLATRLAELAAELGFGFVDPTAALERHAARGEIVFFPMDTHPSPLGHRVIAEVLASALRDE